MSVFSILLIGFLIVRTGKSFLDGLFDPPKITNVICKPRNYNVKYYSDDRLLPNPFHIEYRMIANTVADSWIYEEEWQELVSENHDAPIVEIDIKQPIKYKYYYTFKHVLLANSYLKEQKEYLENLS
jgi:hypothetical protein